MTGSLSIGSVDSSFRVNGNDAIFESYAGRAELVSKTGAYCCGNCYYDGSQWLRHYIAYSAALLVVGKSGELALYRVAAGENPIVWDTTDAVFHAGNYPAEGAATDITTSITAGTDFTLNIPIGANRKLAYFVLKNPALADRSVRGYATSNKGTNALAHQNSGAMSMAGPNVADPYAMGSFSESATDYVRLKSAAIVGTNLALVLTCSSGTHTVKADVWVKAW
jgi:hypothetical protein